MKSLDDYTFKEVGYFLIATNIGLITLLITFEVLL